MKRQHFLILGGTGKTGSRVAQKLHQQGHTHIRIGSRSETPAFDWENAETWPQALEGTDTVYITFQPDLAIPGAPETIRKFTAVANENGVKKMVLLSGRGEMEAEVCEKIVMDTAQEWTIVRASWFNQNFSESMFLDPILSGYVALPRADTLEPFIDADDIADVVVAALTEDKHNGQVYELTGPRLLTFAQAIDEIANAAGREITFQPLSLEENVALLRQHQLPEDYIWLFNYLFEEVLDGRNSSVTDDVQKVLGRRAKDFSEYVKETTSSGIWNPINQTV